MIEIASTNNFAPPQGRELPPVGPPIRGSDGPAGRTETTALLNSAPSDSQQAATEERGADLAQALRRDTLDSLAPRSTVLQLSVDDELGRVVAQVVDRDSGDIVREIPPEELIAMAKTLRALNGQLVDRRI